MNKDNPTCLVYEPFHNFIEGLSVAFDGEISKEQRKSLRFFLTALAHPAGCKVKFTPEKDVDGNPKTIISAKVSVEQLPASYLANLT